MKTKKLYRSKANRVFFGVIGGLGEYFGVDATLLRLAWLLIVIFTGILPGILVYLLAVLIVPKSPVPNPQSEDKSSDDAYSEYKKIV